MTHWHTTPESQVERGASCSLFFLSARGGHRKEWRRLNLEASPWHAFNFAVSTLIFNFFRCRKLLCELQHQIYQIKLWCSEYGSETNPSSLTHVIHYFMYVNFLSARSSIADLGLAFWSYLLLLATTSSSRVHFLIFNEWDMFWLINLSKPVQTRSNLSKLVQTCPNLFKFVKTCSNLSKLVHICPNLSKLVQNCSNWTKLV